ncbi:unnamed protein product [Fusarium equiseti]|uniref:Uncharacterized protein n=1 Tax=Fusarium equiseti TaxID=61235 RepID=A0A8J2IHQ3_FUSEQ|nr:unnamed protein product [Fusarium equiseti]
MPSSAEDVLSPSLKRERESSALFENTKRRKNELVKKIAQQESYFFLSWCEKSMQNVECAADDVWQSEQYLKHAKQELDSAKAKKFENFKLVWKIHAGILKQKDCEETVKRSQKRLNRAQERVLQAQEGVLDAKATKDASIDRLDSLGIGDLDSLIEEFEF